MSADEMTILMNAPFALAHHEFVVENQRPVDYVFRFVNTAFTKLSGLGQEVIGKRVTEVIPGVRESGLIANYANVAFGGQAEYLDQYVPAFNEWVALVVYCPAHGQFVTVHYTEKLLPKSSAVSSPMPFRWKRR